VRRAYCPVRPVTPADWGRRASDRICQNVAATAETLEEFLEACRAAPLVGVGVMFGDYTTNFSEVTKRLCKPRGEATGRAFVLP
jgi:hypothetical protein